MTNAEKKMLAREKPDVLACMVDAKHCKGCIYYKKIYAKGDGSPRCCDYTFATGKLRIGDTAHCKVKKTARKKKGD
jgi:hypothetical protein